ncbi:hypothetical protein [Streptomyces sp. AM 2-1-1]|uniref:hypothetical protein n=1 Tax=Streptomyces sp. AM 2-1-1 TaxID=3028709 RepID=UPI0023B906BC|nr:hypothetical protein [Streptomyces sp. AM 2-1-1]WEH44022.1 hypothetical protein PZB77_31170 [Streptomyces sp. AM 2-1-1]
MFTGTAEELRARQAQARELAEHALLDQIDALGAGGGQLHTPGGIIRNRPPGQGWTVADH